MKRSFIDGSTLLGTALTLFGVGTIMTTQWQKNIMYGCFFIFLVLSLSAFWEF